MNTVLSFNQKLLKFLSVFILLTFISITNISGCDDDNGDSNTIGPAGGEIMSSDGRVLLNIPPGALDEEVEITLDMIPLNQNSKTNLQEQGEEEDPAVPLLAYDAQPDGLVFNSPVEFEADLTDLISNFTDENNNITGDASIISLANISSDGMTIEPANNQTVDVNLSSQNTTLSANIDHFSNIVIFEVDGAKLIAEVAGVPSGEHLANTSIGEVFVEIFATGTGTGGGFEAESVTYTDFSLPMVIYDGTNPLVPSGELGEEDFVAPYSCGDVGDGFLNADVQVTGVFSRELEAGAFGLVFGFGAFILKNNINYLFTIES
ncbi:MAG: hypothetical protein ACR2NW_07925, partial [Thermodesulfobacteriota bacterium]